MRNIFFTTPESEYKDNIQAEQLAGQWFASMTGLGDLVPPQMQRKTLKKVFDFNVMKFGDGKMAAVSGMGANGLPLEGNQQVGEGWSGATFSVAALMLSDGMKDEAYHTAWGVYHVVYETKGYWFRTPEAYDITGSFRASMYMRPAGIWAMEVTAPAGSEVALGGKFALTSRNPQAGRIPEVAEELPRRMRHKSARG